MLITVFTPTYNRAHLLKRLYDSLRKQTFKDFEWVIVDDGSKDNTRSVVKSLELREESIFSIRYFYQKNGGKHRAINRGIKEAKGELFFIADSDDMLPFNSLEEVFKQYNTIEGDSSFAGICGLDASFKGQIIGTGLPEDIIDDNSASIRYRKGILGDMKEVFITKVIKEFPFPEIENELFCPEVLVWNRIAKKYKLRYFNRVIYLVEYQEGGISANITKSRINSPIATMMTYAERYQFDFLPPKLRWRTAINYWRFYFHSSPQNRSRLSYKIPLHFYPLGWFLYVKDIFNGHI